MNNKKEIELIIKKLEEITHSLSMEALDLPDSGEADFDEVCIFLEKKAMALYKATARLKDCFKN